MLATNDSKTVDAAISAGLLPVIYKNLFRLASEAIKETLWGLSNITASEQNHIKIILENEEMINKVICLINSERMQIKAEALWVMTNLIITCSDELLKEFTAKYIGVFLEPLSNSIN